MLADSFGRIATDLRVSLTDRCNLRCAYCMPPEGLDWLPAPDQLTDDEVVRLVGVGVEMVRKEEVYK
jgi:cyclic pyranopterin phosphate synthase